MYKLTILNVKVGLGKERATQMCPLGLLVDANVPLALHSGS